VLRLLIVYFRRLIVSASIRRQGETVRNVVLLVVFMAAILPAPRSFASTNSFTDADADALLKLENAALTLDGDINQSASTLNHQFNDFAQEQIACLLELEQSVQDIMRELDVARDFVELSVQMEDSRDASKLNLRIAHRAVYALKAIASARKSSLRQAATCSTSALVNTYSQRSVALADHATAAISAIKDRLASDTNSQ
jgi:hypothetical protein